MVVKPVMMYCLKAKKKIPVTGVKVVKKITKNGREIHIQHGENKTYGKMCNIIANLPAPKKKAAPKKKL